MKASGIQPRHVVCPMTGRVKRLFNFVKRLKGAFPRVDAQFHIEILYPENLLAGKSNFALPNPEFTNIRRFENFSRNLMVLCKTQHAFKLFNSTKVPCRYLGFTSEDLYLPSIKKDYSRFLHTAGTSQYKGTRLIVEAWMKNPHWPKITIICPRKDKVGRPLPEIPSAPNIEPINHRLPEKEFNDLQNECGIHLCPSEVEGFGHYIVEALAMGNLVVTTNSPPMNEHVRPDFGYLLDTTVVGKMGMVDRVNATLESFQETIEKILRTPLDQRVEMGKKSRAQYLEIDSRFKKNFSELIESLRLGS